MNAFFAAMLLAICHATSTTPPADQSQPRFENVPVHLNPIYVTPSASLGENAGMNCERRGGNAIALTQESLRQAAKTMQEAGVSLAFIHSVLNAESGEFEGGELVVDGDGNSKPANANRYILRLKSMREEISETNGTKRIRDFDIPEVLVLEDPAKRANLVLPTVCVSNDASLASVLQTSAQ